MPIQEKGYLDSGRELHDDFGNSGVACHHPVPVGDSFHENGVTHLKTTAQ